MSFVILSDGSVGQRDSTPASTASEHNRRVLAERHHMLLAEKIADGSITFADEPGRGVTAAMDSIAANQDVKQWITAKDGEQLVGRDAFRRAQRDGKIKMKRIGSRRWLVRKGDVLALLARETPRASADETIARAIMQARGGSTIPKHSAGIRPDVGLSDDTSDDERHAAFRQRRRYCRRGMRPRSAPGPAPDLHLSDDNRGDDEQHVAFRERRRYRRNDR